MFATQDRAQTREVFFRAWRRYREQQTLEGVEQTMVRVLLRHPEYHDLLDRPDEHRDRDYSPDLGQVNPFMHLGLHLVIEEQLALGQPGVIRRHYQTLLRRLADEHAVQHRLMECLGETLWRAGHERTGFSESVYLECLERMTTTPGDM